MSSIGRSTRPIVPIGLIILFSLLLIIVLVFIMWSVLYVFRLRTDPWSILESISTAISTALIVGASAVAYRELHEVAASRHLEIATQLFTELNSSENITARRWVFQNLGGDPQEELPSLSPEGRDAIKRVLNSLDRAAFLTQNRLIPEEMIMPWMSVMIVKAWTKLEPYVVFERMKRQEPDYYQWAQIVSERCIAWRAQNVPDARIVWLRDAL